jgi:PAS domain S-box-containing protein
MMKPQHSAAPRGTVRAIVFEQAFRYARDVILLMADDCEIFECNDAALAAYGYTRKEMLALNLCDLRAPHTRIALAEDMRRASFPAGHTFNTVHQRKNGAQFHAEVSSRLLEADGRRYRVNIVRDISAQQAARETLSTRHRQLAEAQHLARMGSWELSMQTGECTWSEELYRLFGGDPMLPIPRYQQRFDLYEEKSAAALSRAVDQALKSGDPYELEVEYLMPEGTRKWLLVRGEVVRDPDGGIIGLRGTVQDIDERKRLQEAHARLAAIVESSSDAIVGVDLNRIVTTWNAAAEEVYGYSASEIIGQWAGCMVPPDQEAALMAAKKRMMRGEKIGPYEAVRVRKDGRLIQVSITISPIRDHENRIIGNSAIVREISNRTGAGPGGA